MAPKSITKSNKKIGLGHRPVWDLEKRLGLPGIAFLRSWAAQEKSALSGLWAIAPEPMIVRLFGMKNILPTNG